MVVAPKSLTLEEFLRLPEEKPEREFMAGEILQKMSPKARHSVLQSEFIRRLDVAAHSAGLDRALPELRVTFAGASVLPDVSVFRQGRMPRDAAGELVDDVLIPPDIAIEIVSPEQSVNGLIRRCRWYVTHGVEIAVLVDPVDRSVLAFLADGTVRELIGEDAIDLHPVIPSFDLTVDQLFLSLSQ